MANVIAGMTMSLDGFVADQSGSADRLYPDLAALRGTAYMNDVIEATGAVLIGRRTFEMADSHSYVGNYEFQVPIFVLTHHPPMIPPKQDDRLTFTFVSDGIAAVGEHQGEGEQRGLRAVDGDGGDRMLNRHKTRMVDETGASPGRDRPAFAIPDRHAVLGTPLQPPYPDEMETAVFGLGCFWGAERLFWGLDGVYTTAVGYAGGFTPHPTYEEVCSGRTGHAEVVLVVFDPHKISYADLLKVFFEAHDPTQGMRQGNDVGTQYRSAILFADETQRRTAEEAGSEHEAVLKKEGYGKLTTEVVPLGSFFYAEDYHQQYLHKVP